MEAIDTRTKIVASVSSQPLMRPVAGAIDLTHAARADLGGDFVRAEACAGLDGHGCVEKRWIIA